MLPELDTPFRWQGDHIAAEVGGARALFTTRRGGVSEGPFGSLNLVGGLRRSMAKAGYCDLKEFQKVGLTVGS